MRRRLLLWLIAGLDDTMIGDLDARLEEVRLRRAARLTRLWSEK